MVEVDIQPEVAEIHGHSLFEENDLKGVKIIY